LRIALFSDVHGCLTALRAALGELNREEPDLTVFLGDAVHYGPSPNECADLLRESGVECIQGNCDRAVSRGRSSTGEVYENPHWTNIAGEFLKWTTGELSAVNRKWLRGLPEELRFQRGKTTLHCVHGLPGRQSEGLPVNAAGEVYDAILSRSGADILACGLTHAPAVIRRSRGMIVNPGAIGGGTVPGGGTFMILNLPEEGHPQVETLEFTFDAAELQREFAGAGRGELFLKCLKLGRDQRGHWHTGSSKCRQQWAELQ